MLSTQNAGMSLSRTIPDCQLKAPAHLPHKRRKSVAHPNQYESPPPRSGKRCLSHRTFHHTQSSISRRHTPSFFSQPQPAFPTSFDLNPNRYSSYIFKVLPGALGSLLQCIFSAGSKGVLLLSATTLFLQPSSCIAAELLDFPSLRNAVEVEVRAIELPPIPTDFPPLPDLTLPIYKKVVLPNGLKVLLLEDHELGLVGGQILVKGGGKADPAGKVGLAAVTGAVQRGGGTDALPGDALNARLESMAARIESGAGVSEMSVAFRCLREDLEEVFPIFTDVVLHPAMPQDKLDLVRRQLLGVLARRNDDPGGIASREVPKLLYGPTSPYARVPQASDVKAITQSDLVAFHDAVYRPNEAVLGLWGDFDSTTAQDLILSSMGGWSGGHPSQPPPPPLEEEGSGWSPPGVYLINRPGLTQGYVRMAELGTTLDDPDLFALDVLNSELNGFGGRLFDEVRSREGLAYSVSGGWAPAMEHRGAFVAGGESRVSSIPQFVAAVQRVMRDVRTQPPTQEELSQAKDSSLNSFVFNFADSGAQLSRIMTYELFGIDQDFIFRYKRGIEETSAEDVLRAARRHLHPEKQTILIVTDVDSIRSSLEDLGLPLVDLSVD